MANFDKTLPSGSLPFNQGDNDIRTNMAALEERLAKEHDFPQNPFTARSGRHTFGRGNAAARDAAITAPQDGNVWFDTDRAEWQVRSGGLWVASSQPALGEVRILTHGLGLPFGWRECNGQSLSTATYSALFAKLGYLYGGGGASFNVPDLRGRVPVGRYFGGDADGDYVTLGNTYGEKRHTLTLAETPAHAHAGSSVSAAVLPESVALAAEPGSQSFFGSGSQTRAANTSHTHGLVIGSEGGGGAHENRPLMITLLFMIYVGL